MSQQSRSPQRPRGGTRQKSPATQRPRRTNAQRTAETRHKLINATIDCLYRLGYAATTTIVVAEQAKVSRGAMLHHFPTRVDLLLATAKHILEDQRASRVKALREEKPSARVGAAAEVSWNVQNRPSAVALIEIMMGSRSDPDLQKGMAPFVQQMSDWRHEAAEHAAESLGIDDVDAMHDLIHVHMAALRGLLVELMFTRNVEEIESARKLLTQYERHFGAELIRKANAKSASRTRRHNARRSTAKKDPPD